MPRIDIVIPFFLIDCKSRRLTPKTLKWYGEMLQKFSERFPDRDIESISSTDIRMWVIEMADRGLAPSTQHAHVRTLRILMNFCEQEGFVEDNPMSRVRMPKLDKRVLPSFTRDEISMMLSACRTERDKAIILFMLDTGLRVSECSAVKMEDIDLEKREVRVIQGKGRKDRSVYFGGTTARQLIKMFVERDELPGDSGPLWRSLSSRGEPDKHGSPLGPIGIQQMFRQIKLETEITHCSPHTCRRTFATLNLRAGMNIFELARIMGHTDIKVLQRYLEVLDEDTKRAHKKAGALDEIMKGF